MTSDKSSADGTATGGFGGVPGITNAKMTLADVPSRHARWQTIWHFALSINAYELWGTFEKVVEVAHRPEHETLTELRTALFLEQRRWGREGYTPDRQTARYIRTLLEQIRAALVQGNRR